MKTEETKRLEMAIWNATNKQGVFGCFEVTIGWFGKERVDYMTFDTKGDFRCYEIKVTKADFHSTCHNSFVGNLSRTVKIDEPTGGETLEEAVNRTAREMAEEIGN